MIRRVESVSRETRECLEEFATLLRSWTQRINLIATSTRDDTWNRHIVDSVQIYPDDLADGFHWVDLGSGGGLPGIVCAIIAREDHPAARFTLIESDNRKSVFLRTAIRTCNLTATVIPERIETAPPQSADILSARALAPLSDLLPMTERHLKPGGQAIFMKGSRHQEDLKAVAQNWSFDLDQKASITDPNARILTLRNIIRVR